MGRRLVVVPMCASARGAHGGITLRVTHGTMEDGKPTIITNVEGARTKPSILPCTKIEEHLID